MMEKVVGEHVVEGAVFAQSTRGIADDADLWVLRCRHAGEGGDAWIVVETQHP